MVLVSLLVLMLLPGLGWPQAAAAPAQKAPANAPSGTAAGEKPGSPAPAQEQEDNRPPAGKAPNLAPTAPVITIEGLCPGSTARTQPNAPASADKKPEPGPTDPACKTVVTRAQFENLVNLLNVAPPMRRQLATVYPRLLLFADAAKSMGLDKDPRFQQVLQFATLQILAQEFTRAMQQKAADISDADLQKYYQENSAKFEQTELQRIFVPKTRQEQATGNAATAKSDTGEAAMKELAEKLHQRAAAGGDFTSLQKEAFAAAGLHGTEPNVSLGKITRGNLPQSHEKVLDLKPGQVSDLITDPGGYYLYKVISKQQMPLEQAKPQIRNALQAQRLQESMEELMSKIHPQLNLEYFSGETGESSSGPDQPGPAGAQGESQPSSKPAPASPRKPTAVPPQP
jgi:peptidyl-prolyl cis-trans isomerase C